MENNDKNTPMPQSLKTAVISCFASDEECEKEAILFTEIKMKVAGGLLSEDYKIGFKEGIENYLRYLNNL